MSKPYAIKRRSTDQVVEGPGLEFKNGLGQWVLVFPTVPNRVVARGTQKTGSEGHSFDRNTGLWNGGGPFDSVLAQNHYGYHNANFPSNLSKAGGYRYSGPVITPILSPMSVDDKSIEKAAPSEHALTVAGTNAIAACAPTNPASTLGTGLAEVYREGAPKIPGIQGWEQRANLLKSVGSEFLNVEFGWAPLVREVKEVSSAISKHHTIMQQYAADSGKDVRRRFSFPIQESVTNEVQSGWRASFPGFSTDQFRDGTTPSLEITKISKTKQWFSGSFTYALPSSGNAWDSMARAGDQANHLLGTTIDSPEVLWALTPWSWAVDWFSNTSEVMTNLTNFVTNGLMMRYGFIMEEHSVKTVYTLTGSGQKGCPTPPPSWTFLRFKRRRPANPFGFGIGWEDLSPSQLAIAAAVGITQLL